MNEPSRQLRWTQPAWFVQASVWIHAELEEMGISVNGVNNRTRAAIRAREMGLIDIPG